MSGVAEGSPVLAIDAGSPVVSVAVASDGEVLAEASDRLERSSARLLPLIEEILELAGIGRRQLGGIVALRGPGSFTGLRVGLATALGLQRALGLPAAGIPTFDVLATFGPGDGSTVVAGVDALRGDWFVQPFRSGEPAEPQAPPRLLPAPALPGLAPCLLVGFGVGGIAGLEGSGVATRQPSRLAGAAARLATRTAIRWDAGSLLRPLYLRPPAVSGPA